MMLWTMKGSFVSLRMIVVAFMVVVWAIRTMLGVFAEVLAWGEVIAAG